MDNEYICVFCGEKPGPFRRTTISCAGTWQPACKTCENELKDLDEVEVCRRALVRGKADNPERLRERIHLESESENHRPKCLRCGGSLTFMKMQELDNSPMRDRITTEPFKVLPAVCRSCGKYEFYDPMIVRRNKYHAYLIRKDTQA